MKDDYNKNKKIIEQANALGRMLATWHNHDAELIDELRSDEVSMDAIERLSDKHYYQQSLELRKEIKAKEKADVAKLMAKLEEGRGAKKKAVLRKLVAYTALAAAILFVTFAVYDTTKKSEVSQIDLDSLVSELKEPTIIYETGETEKVNNKIEVVDLSQLKGVVNTLQGQKVVGGEVKPTVYNTLLVPKQYVCTVMLPDSSVVTLNAGSKLVYPTQFSDDVREVSIKGEGYFSVRKSDVPFIVKTKGVEVKVYGTEFNVSSYGDMFETVLVSGSVGVNFLEGAVFNVKGELMIKPNQKIETKDGVYARLSEVNAKDYVSWTKGEFRFDEVPLGEVMGELARWYDVKFVVNNEEYNDIVVTGNFKHSDKLQSILTAIERTIDLIFINNGDAYELEQV